MVRNVRARKPSSSRTDRLSRAIGQMAADPRFVAAMAPQAMSIVAGSPTELRETMRADLRRTPAT